MADLGIIFLRRRYPIHWYQSSYIFITGSMPFRYFWATLYRFKMRQFWCPMIIEIMQTVTCKNAVQIFADRAFQSQTLAPTCCNVYFVKMRSHTTQLGASLRAILIHYDNPIMAFIHPPVYMLWKPFPQEIFDWWEKKGHPSLFCIKAWGKE